MPDDVVIYIAHLGINDLFRLSEVRTRAEGVVTLLRSAGLSATAEDATCVDQGFPLWGLDYVVKVPPPEAARARELLKSAPREAVVPGEIR